MIYTPFDNTSTVELGKLYQDDVGTQWEAITELRHHSEPSIVRYILKELCLPSREPRSAIVKSDGTQFACKSSPAIKIISLVK